MKKLTINNVDRQSTKSDMNFPAMATISMGKLTINNVGQQST